jgi:membrane protein DedA with SNARE-associated domain
MIRFPMPSIAYLIHAYGLIVVAVLVGLECVGLPFPGETVLIAASVIAGTEHNLNIVSVILTAGGASIIGRMIGYVIGREFGYWLLLRYGRYLWISESRIKLGQYLFLQHGGKVIVLAQFLPVLRSLAGILAGANRMPWPRFMLTNIIGALLWATLYGLVVYSLGREVERFSGWMVMVLAIAFLLLIFGVAAFVRRNEAQLITEAEKALPGPLKW